MDVEFLLCCFISVMQLASANFILICLNRAIAGMMGVSTKQIKRRMMLLSLKMGCVTTTRALEAQVNDTEATISAVTAVGKI